MARLVLLTVSLVALASCNEPNPEFCKNPNNADDPFCKMGGACTANSSCTSTPKFPVCDLTDNGGTCVLCTASDHTQCTGLTPHCEDHACVACVDDNDCGAKGVGVCMPTGDCADPNSIIHAVSTGGSSNTTCGAMGNACNLDTAITAAKPGKNVIKLDDAGTYTSEMDGLIIDTDAGIGLTIDARDATLHRTNDGPILTINSGKGVTILGGTIEGANGGGGDGIRCDNATLTVHGTTIRMSEESGIDATGCTLTLSRSRIVSNRGGGINVSNGKFVIVGNMFLSNGNSSSTNPGVAIVTTADSTNRLEFNTIANNATTTSIVTAGIDCKIGTGFTASHNIIWNNMIGGNASTAPQTANNCTHVYSAIGPAAVAGTGNISDPPGLSADGHLATGSPALKKVELGADLTGLVARDIDGDLRVAPADLGADQLPRP